MCAYICIITLLCKFHSCNECLRLHRHFSVQSAWLWQPSAAGANTPLHWPFGIAVQWIGGLACQAGLHTAWDAAVQTPLHLLWHLLVQPLFHPPVYLLLQLLGGLLLKLPLPLLFPGLLLGLTALDAAQACLQGNVSCPAEQQALQGHIHHALCLHYKNVCGVKPVVSSHSVL